MSKAFGFFTKKQNSMSSAAFILMIMVVASGLLGLVRLRILYDRFTPDQTGVFFAAFRIPNLLFEFLAMGTVTTAFIPVFTKFLSQGREKTGQVMASVVINITVIVLGIILIPVLIWTPEISRLFAPGFSEAEIIQMTSFTRIMVVLQVVPLIIGNFLTGMLQSYNFFIIPAMAPVLYNIGMIIGVLLLSPSMGLMSAVAGVGIGAGLFMLVQIPLIVHLGYKHVFSRSLRTEGVSDVIKLMIPRMVGLGASQIDVSIDLMLSSLLGAKMVTVFFLAQSLQQLPVRLFGYTISQAALPTLSNASASNKYHEFTQSILKAYQMIIFLIIPASAFFIVLRTPLVRLIFGASMFDWEATVLTAYTLSWFSVSLVAQAISQVFIRGFYALYDSKTPVTVSLITIGVNAVLSSVFILVYHMPVWSLALSSTCASILNAVLLLILLFRRLGTISLREIMLMPVKMGIAGFVSAVVMFICMKIFDQLVFDTTRVFGLILLTGVVGVLGLSVYVFLAWVFNVTEVLTFMRFIDRVKQLRSLLMTANRQIPEDLKESG